MQCSMTYVMTLAYERGGGAIIHTQVENQVVPLRFVNSVFRNYVRSLFIFNGDGIYINFHMQHSLISSDKFLYNSI